MWQACKQIIKSELLLASRQPSDVLNPVIFYLMVASLFPLAITPDNAVLETIAPGIIWIAALLAQMVALPRLFANEYIEGTLQHYLLSPHPLSLLVLVKIFAHWLISGLPLIIISPLLAGFFHLSFHCLTAVTLSLLLGTLALSAIGAIGAAITVNLAQGSVLIVLLTMPLSIPILIFGAMVIIAANAGLSILGHLALLAAFLVGSLSLAPAATAAALRINGSH